MNFAAMIVAQGLIIVSRSHGSSKTIFLKEHCIILVQLLLLKLIISEHLRRPIYEFSGENLSQP